MLTDAELDRLIIKEYGPNADLQWHASFARAVERAAYEAAIKACAVTRGKNHAEAAAFKSGTKAYVQACDDCEDAIRSLMEQPK